MFDQVSDDVSAFDLRPRRLRLLLFKPVKLPRLLRM
jgi:hypothetical protein